MHTLSELDALNNDLSDCLLTLEKIPAEDESTDELVQKLLVYIDRRQFLLDKVLGALKPGDQQMLETQLLLTEKFERQAKIILKHRQELLHLGNKTKRQINVYKSIGAK